MARYFDIHPANPQQRAIVQAADIVRDGGVIAYPTDSCYALGCQLGNGEGINRIRSIRDLDERHHLTLVCQDFAQLGQFALVANPVFRAIKAATPGSYTFILRATREVPKRLQHPSRKTIGVRIPDHRVVHALLGELREPILSSTLLLPGAEDPLNDTLDIRAALEYAVDLILDSGPCGVVPTTVVDLTGEAPAVLRAGKGSLPLIGL